MFSGACAGIVSHRRLFAPICFSGLRAARAKCRAATGRLQACSCKSFNGRRVGRHRGHHHVRVPEAVGNSSKIALAARPLLATLRKQTRITWEHSHVDKAGWRRDLDGMELMCQAVSVNSLGCSGAEEGPGTQIIQIQNEKIAEVVLGAPDPLRGFGQRGRCKPFAGVCAIEKA